MKLFIILSTLAFVAVQLSWAGPAKRELKPLEIAEMANYVVAPAAIENVPILAKRQADPQPSQLFDDMTANMVPLVPKREMQEMQEVQEVPERVEKKLESAGAESCACTG